MTALNAYIRLESTGLWRAGPGVQRRDVYVFLGDASLVIADKSETALTHWSLPAIERLNPGQEPALFGPDLDAVETLEIDDAEMIAALEQVRKAVQAADPKPGRLRLWSGLAMALALVLVATLWLPGALLGQADRVVPQTKRLEIGQQLLTLVEDLTGPICAAPQGQTELRRLSRRLDLAPGTRLVILDRWPNVSGHLPGPILLFDRALVDAHDMPEVLAGYALAEAERLAGRNALQDLLASVGTLETLRLLATGNIGDRALRRYADSLITRPQAPVAPAPLLARFEAARVSSTAFASALMGQDDLQAALLRNDPFVASAAPVLMSDNSWVTLQSICDGS